MTILFSGKVFCGYCKKKHRAKKFRKHQSYICSGYSNYGRGYCKQNRVSQFLLLELLSHRHKHELSKEDIDSLVEKIIVTEEEIRIKFYDEDDIVLNQKFGSF